MSPAERLLTDITELKEFKDLLETKEAAGAAEAYREVLQAFMETTTREGALLLIRDKYKARFK